MSNKICYIIIEDSEEASLIETAIQETELGYTSIIAKSEDSAKERFSNEQNFQPDFIFIDWNLGLMKHIKKISRLAKKQVIVYSTEISPNEIQDARFEGATHCLLKTTHDTALVKILLHLFCDKHTPFVLVYSPDERGGYLR